MDLYFSYNSYNTSIISFSQILLDSKNRLYLPFQFEKISKLFLLYGLQKERMEKFYESDKGLLLLVVTREEIYQK